MKEEISATQNQGGRIEWGLDALDFWMAIGNLP